MKIVRFAGQIIQFKYVYNKKTKTMRMVALEGGNPDHLDITRLLPTTEGQITMNDPDMSPVAPMPEDIPYGQDQDQQKDDNRIRF